MQEFIIKLCGVKVRTTFSHGKPLCIYCRYHNQVKRKNYFVIDQYGSKIESSFFEFTVKRLSKEQMACIKLTGLIQDGQVCICNSEDAPIVLFEKTCKEDWSENLTQTLIREMYGNQKFEKYIRDKLRRMINEMKIDLKLMPFCCYFESIRNKDFARAYNVRKLKKICKITKPKIKKRFITKQTYYVRDQYGSLIESGIDVKIETKEG